MARRRLPTCFVIMPFGTKKTGDFEIDFDLIYEQYIEPAGKLAGFDTCRADSDEKPGFIVKHLMESIYESDLVVADVTYYNPNVYYELGIRHALCRHGTVLVRRAAGDLGVKKLRWRSHGLEPRAFDLEGLAIWSYEFSKAALASEINTLRDRMIRAARLTSSDSPVFTHLPSLRVTAGAQPASINRDRTYELLAAPGKLIGYRAGDIAGLTGTRAVDFWVNSENTLMQMARMSERSISSTIRYRGARDADPGSPGFEDTIADDLKRAMGNRRSVEEGDVVVTTSGKLAETHGVKAVLHAATVIGTPGQGFVPIRRQNLATAVSNVVAEARRLIRKGDPALAGESLVIPLFGMGQAGRDSGDPMVIAGLLVDAAIEALSNDTNAGAGPDLKAVYFSAFGEHDVSLLLRIFEGFVADKILKHVPGR